MDRRLAAVLIADVVGYGRLSQIDEEGTRARFQSDLKEGHCHGNFDGASGAAIEQGHAADFVRPSPVPA